MKIPDEVFKAYDIRGRYPEQIDENAAYEIARAFARVLGEEYGSDASDKSPAESLRVALGHDMRLSSPALSGRFRQGLLDEGCDVVEIGEVGTEMLYHTVGSLGLDGGTAVTASHNPKAYTGMKLVRRGAVALSGDSGIDEVKQICLGENLATDQPGGSAEKVDIYPSYKDKISTFFDPSLIKPLRVVLDGGHGMAGRMISPIFDSLPLVQIRKYMEPDGNFPNHEPNPLLEENRREIMDEVRSEKADLGIAWDGDADRCFFIDDGGEFVPGDFTTALLSKQVLKKEPGAAIIYDVRASRAVKDTIEGAGGCALINRVGHSFFKARMREANAVFGGEVSGHYYFRDFWCADSGMIPALLMLELLSEEGVSLSQLLSEYREKYFISGEINSTVDDQQSKMSELEDRYSDGRVEHLDGISVDYDDWHFNVRPSNTEPLLRLNLEADTQKDMENRRDEVLSLIRDGS